MKKLLLALCMILCGCAANVSVGGFIGGATETAPAHAVIHADTDFTTTERAWFAEAARLWSVQTSGVASIVVVYDLDFSSVSSLAEHKLLGDIMMVRAESYMDSVANMDSEACPSELGKVLPCVLAWVTPSGGIHNPYKAPVSLVFIPDRYKDGEYAKLVVLHEFGHLLGLPHLPERQAIMYPASIPGKTVCLKKPDLVSFCSVNECGDKKMYPCE